MLLLCFFLSVGEGKGEGVVRYQSRVKVVYHVSPVLPSRQFDAAPTTRPFKDLCVLGARSASSSFGMVLYFVMMPARASVGSRRTQSTALALSSQWVFASRAPEFDRASYSADARTLCLIDLSFNPTLDQFFGFSAPIVLQNP